jgi:glycoprotein 6-alpha-L-fucosyltransferase
VAYEMMQTNRVDASNSFFSLDDIYYFGGQNAHDRVAVLPNAAVSSQDVALQVLMIPHLSRENYFNNI